MPDVYWYVPGSSPVQKMEELAGKKVAYSLAGSSSHMAVLALVDQLKAKGLKPPEPISLGGLPDTFTGVKTGQAEAGWAAPPFFLDRVEKGEIRIAFRGSELAALRDLTIRVNFVNADFAKKNPEAVRRFFRAHQKALDFMLDRREETAKIWMRRAELKLPEAIVMKTWDFYPRSAMALKPIKGIQTAVDDAVKFNFLKQPLTKGDLDRLIDLSFLP